MGRAVGGGAPAVAAEHSRDVGTCSNADPDVVALAKLARRLPHEPAVADPERVAEHVHEVATPALVCPVGRRRLGQAGVGYHLALQLPQLREELGPAPRLELVIRVVEPRPHDRRTVNRHHGEPRGDPGEVLDVGADPEPLVEAADRVDDRPVHRRSRRNDRGVHHRIRPRLPDLVPKAAVQGRSLGSVRDQCGPAGHDTGAAKSVEGASLEVVVIVENANPRSGREGQAIVPATDQPEILLVRNEPYPVALAKLPGRPVARAVVHHEELVVGPQLLEDRVDEREHRFAALVRRDRDRQGTRSLHFDHRPRG